MGCTKMGKGVREKMKQKDEAEDTKEKTFFFPIFSQRPSYPSVSLILLLFLVSAYRYSSVFPQAYQHCAMVTTMTWLPWLPWHGNKPCHRLALKLWKIYYIVRQVSFIHLFNKYSINLTLWWAKGIRKWTGQIHWFSPVWWKSVCPLFNQMVFWKKNEICLFDLDWWKCECVFACLHVLACVHVCVRSCVC